LTSSSPISTCQSPSGHEALNNNFADDERSHIKAEITIVPSCYESDTERGLLLVRRVELGKSKEVAVKVDIIVSHLNLPVSKRFIYA
jgi:hypothetical protein